VIGAVALGVAIETLVELGFDEMLHHEVELGEPPHAAEPDPPAWASRRADAPAGASASAWRASSSRPPPRPRAAALSHEWGIAVRNGCFCANPYVFHLLHMDKKAVDAV